MTATTLKEQAMNSATRLASKVISSTRNLTTATGDVAYTGVGFTPTSIIVFSALSDAMSVGVADSAKTGGGLSHKAATAYYSMVGAGYGANVLISCDQGANNYHTASVKSYDADGFTLTWTKVNSPTGTLELVFLCFR